MTCKRDIKPAPFQDGGLQVVATRAQLTLQTSAGLFNAFFRPVVFREPLADTAKVMAAYPKGTILPYAGPISAIPAGWRLCDGTNNTVNLVARLPIGAGNDGQLGSQDGKLTHSHDYAKARTGGADIGGFTLGHAFQAVHGPDLADHSHEIPAGTTKEASSLPPVTRVYFIQKVQ